MCGIIGVIEKDNCVPELLTGLARLEYRGYDSAGIGIKNGNGLVIKKVSGTVDKLVPLASMEHATMGIAHTRWATHGPPTTINAHPHTSADNSVAIVHNGVIENYQELKSALMTDGVPFSSDTDSEVIAHLIAKEYSGNLAQAVQRMVGKLSGKYAFIAIHALDNTLVCATNGSPLVIGMKEGALYCASDMHALPQTRTMRLEDNEIAILSPTTVTVEDFFGNTRIKKIEEPTTASGAHAKGEHAHFMLKEIFEQPAVLRTLATPEQFETVTKAVASLSPAHILILGCGTSYHAGLLGKYYLEQLDGISVSVEQASEFLYRTPFVPEGTLAIGISQSGETADTIAALAFAKKQGATTLALINTPHSTLAQKADRTILFECGPEIGVASTKAFTAAVVRLLQVSMVLAPASQQKTVDELKTQLEHIPILLEEIFTHQRHIQKTAEVLAQHPFCMYAGRCLGYPVALEGALKFKEITYIPTEAFAGGEFKHGPLALVDSTTAVINILLHDVTYPKMLHTISEIGARDGNQIIITNGKVPELKHFSADALIELPTTHALLAPILASIVTQLLAYYAATAKGNDPDKPRNLAKSVTVE